MMVGYNHDDPYDFDGIPNGSTVYILDISFAWNEMQDLNHRCHMIWIDHHLSKIKEAENAKFEPIGYRLTNHAACYLTYKWFGVPIGHDGEVPWGNSVSIKL
jgi:oligoribonuclease NrnB/cAMP/cGMP phosphodiesterase (DHH superfamily)